MEYYPIKPSENGPTAWEDYAVVFDFDGTEEIQAADYAGLEEGYEYRLVMTDLRTEPDRSGGYYWLYFCYKDFEAHGDESWQVHTMSYRQLSYARTALSGHILLHGPGSFSEYFGVTNSMNAEYSQNYVNIFSPYSSTESTGRGPQLARGFSILSYTGTYLVGRCVLQRRKQV